MNIGPVDPEIIWLTLKKKSTQAKYIALPASLPSRLKKFYHGILPQLYTSTCIKIVWLLITRIPAETVKFVQVMKKDKMAVTCVTTEIQLSREILISDWCLPATDQLPGWCCQRLHLGCFHDNSIRHVLIAADDQIHRHLRVL